jgi:uncharacterized membrane protein
VPASELGLGAAVCFGAFFAAPGSAAESGGPAAVTASRASAAAILLLARLVLRERLARGRGVGVSAVLTGIVLISVG